MRRLAVLIPLILAVVAMGACSGGDSDGDTAGVAVRDIAGAVEIRRVGDARWSATGDTTMHPGDRLRVRDRDDEAGRAVLRLAGNGTLELRGGSVVALVGPAGHPRRRPRGRGSDPVGRWHDRRSL